MTYPSDGVFPGTELEPLCTAQNVVAKLLRPLTAFEATCISDWIAEASAQMRQRTPFDLDARIGAFIDGDRSESALDPVLVAGVTASVIKNFLVNPEGVASASHAEGPFSNSATYVNRYDKSGSDVRGRIQVTDSDVDQLRPAVPADIPFLIRVGIPTPSVMVPAGGRYRGLRGGGVPSVVPDIDALPNDASGEVLRDGLA